MSEFDDILIQLDKERFKRTTDHETAAPQFIVGGKILNFVMPFDRSIDINYKEDLDLIVNTKNFYPHLKVKIKKFYMIQNLYL